MTPNSARKRRSRQQVEDSPPAPENASPAIQELSAGPPEPAVDGPWDAWQRRRRRRPPARSAPPAPQPAAEADRAPSDQPSPEPAADESEPVQDQAELPAGAEEIQRGIWVVRPAGQPAKRGRGKSGPGVVWLSPYQASAEFRVTPHVVYYALGRQRQVKRPRPIGDWFRVLVNPSADARARKLAAEAELAELEVERQRGRLIQVEEVIQVLSKLLAPLAQRLRSLPAELAQHCNPADLVLARDVLQRWVDDSLPLLRQDLTRIIEEARETDD